MNSIEAKIVVLGSQGVGKTSVVVRYIANGFSKHVSPTIGASFFTCKIAIESYRIKLQVWDTAGQERFRSMAPMYYRKANAAMLVYDITSADSFQDMKTWVREVQKNIENKLVMVVLGNKSDLDSEREVSLSDGQEYAASIGAFHFETSAYTNVGIEESFLQIAKNLIYLCETDNNHGLSIKGSSKSKFGGFEESLRITQPELSEADPGQSKRSCCS